MATWKEIANSEEYQLLTSEEQRVKKVQFYNDIVKNSPKFQAMDSTQQNDYFTNMFPNYEYQKTLIGESLKGLFKEWKNLPLIKQGDIAVENVSKFIEPEVPAGRTTLGLLTKDLPRQIGAEFVRGFKPSTLLPFLGATKIAGGALKPAGKYLWNKVPTPIKNVLTKEFTIGKGQPLAYQEATKKAGLERISGMEEANQVAKALSTDPITGKMLTGEEQRYVGRIFRKEVIDSPALKAHPKYQELKSISREGRFIMDKWSTELAKSGIPKKELAETIENNIGSYMGRMFTSKLNKTKTGFGTKELRLRLNGLKHRKDLSESVLRELGEIKEPALPTAIRVKEISTSIANNKLFNQVAKNPEWVANSNITGNMVKMPNTTSVGALKGKWVIPEIGHDINAVLKTQDKSFPMEVYGKMLSAWKYGKVVLNPATHSRNIMSNSILLDLSGTNHFNQARLFPKVFKDYLSKGEIYQAAKKSGAIGGEWVGEEVAKLQGIYTKTSGGNLSKLLEAIKLPFKKMGDIYQGEEQLAKMVKFAHVLEKGGTPEQAAQEAQKWLFNYKEIPNFMSIVKQVSPFATFTYKSIPRIGEALVKNPMKVYKYYAFFKGFNEASRKLQGMSPEDFAREQNALPPWLFKNIGGMPATLMMPFKNKNGNSQWLNLEYILPVGITTEVLQGGLMKGVVSNPVLTLLGDLQHNKDFKGQDIIPVGADKLEATKIVASYIYRQLAPSLAPTLGFTKGGYSWEKVADALTKTPDYAGRLKGIPTTLLDVLVGLKITPVDVVESEKFKLIGKQKMLLDLQGQALKFLRPNVNEKTREKEIENIFKKMQKVIKQ